MTRKLSAVVEALCFVAAALISPAATAAFLSFSAGATPGSAPADPIVRVTVSGVEVHNARGASFTIPVGTTGHVAIQIVSLPNYQVLNGWTGICAGLNTALPCEFDAGQNITYSAGASIRNLVGTLKFTSSGSSGVSAPTALNLLTTSSPDGQVGTITPNVLQGCCDSLTDTVIGSYVFQPQTVLAGACFQSSTQPSVSASVSEGQTTTLDIRYKPDRCAVAVNLLQPFHGSVKSTPAGIDCPSGPIAPDSSSPCDAFFSFQSSVALQPLPDPGFLFGGWSSGCAFSLEPVCTAIAQPSSAKVPAFVAASGGSADLAIAASSIQAANAGNGKVQVSFTLTNSGPDPAIAARAQIGPTQIAEFSEIPAIVSDSGACNALSICNWVLGDLQPGQSKTVSFTAATTNSDFALKACTLSTTADPDQNDNCTSATAQLAGVINPPPPGSNVTAALGSGNTASTTALKGTSDVAAVQISVTPPSGSSSTAFALTGLSLQASGSGNDQLDIVAVKLYPDSNGNGIVDANEKSLMIASGSFNANDGSAILSFAPTGLLNGRTYVVAVDLNSQLASVMSTLGLVGMIGLSSCGLSRRRKSALAMLFVGAALALSNCGGGGGSGGSAVTRTYKVTVTGLTVTNNGQPVAVDGAPLTGGEIRVQK